MFGKENKILAISPHSDDIELGCAGTLRRVIQEGEKYTHY
ncbi:MAG: PIG-L family deacetylase [Chlamydiia bacterium]|nr:PIG-L family deacetylase [Chlamydiia bacterium]